MPLFTWFLLGRAGQPTEDPKKSTSEPEKARDPEPPRPRGQKRRGVYRKPNFVSTQAEPAPGGDASGTEASAPRVLVFERLSTSIFNRLGAALHPGAQKAKKRRVLRTPEEGGGMKIFTCYASDREMAEPSSIPADVARVDELGQGGKAIFRYAQNAARRPPQGQQGGQAGPSNQG
ncbi:hypothetical protein Taro_032372 [Colocasia esculenta]|uniref:Uncharacterized protein n=1 Tax=Colocasia esculenta TaxID=4460 RepID=A0A843VSI1_COLES|nr:hypothetical protein [Colocasia esculenta]